MNQPSSKQLGKQNNIPIKGKTNTNIAPTNKNAPSTSEKNQKHFIPKRSNSIQGEGPKAIVHQKNK